MNKNIGMFFVAAAILLACSAQATTRHVVTVERNVAVAMRDGVTLRADIYRPDTDEKFPVLLHRTPYDKSYGPSFGLKAAAQGYVVIFQDVRGRYASEGEWFPYKNEANDGYDTVEWAAALPYGDGRVGMFGGSYTEATQLLAATTQPPHLAGITPNVAGSNYYYSLHYQGGAFAQWISQLWISEYLALDTLNRAMRKKVNLLHGTQVLPLVDYPLFESRELPATSVASLAPYFLEWLDHPSYDEYWKRLSIDEHFSKITVPALHMGAWYDIALEGTLRNYVGITEHGASEAARRGQRLIVTVGGHAGDGPKIGAVDFGPASKFDADEVSLRWYDYLFKGVQNEHATGKPVRIFVMGKNEWREEDAWPLARAKNTRYFLHSAGTANGPTGNGSLSTVAPEQENPDRYVYDPKDPMPTIGGPLLSGQQLPLAANGPQDQRPSETRGDVLVYSTPPFEKDTEVTGPVSLELYVSSSAVDTDFTGMLVDVWPNGFAQNLTSGILRLRYRDSFETPKLAVPGQTYHIKVDLWATSHVFLAGYRLRLEVSSSSFPRFDRNMNTGEEQARATRMLKATNEVYHDQARPSALIVPIVRP